MVYPINNDVPLELMREEIRYDPESGDFSRFKLAPKNLGRIGVLRGSMTGNGYLQIRFRMKFYSSHRLAWGFHYGAMPEGLIDHIDGEKTNNRISNLRQATGLQQQKNLLRDPQYQAKSGYQGVQRNHQKTGGWSARISHGAKSIYLGTFPTPEAAHEAYQAKWREFAGEFYPEERLSA